MLIRDLFASDVTRAIPPVVYFHEQSPGKLADEVSEYIITGGWPDDHPNHRRVPEGIHEQYVRLLTGITAALGNPGGPDLPNAWVSGFYGSGKSSFAKLLGLSLDGVALPDGKSLAEAWLQRDTSPKAADLRAAWNALRQRIDPVSVVFDIGSVARDGEQIHAAAIRQVQRRLGYCPEPLVAEYELRLERDGEWARFEDKAREVLGKPWEDVKGNALAEDDFSLVLSELYPDRYPDSMAWITSRAGTRTNSASPEEAVAAIRDMLKFRRPDATLFLVIDEVSQYVLSHRDRVDRLRAFATALGATLRGKAWLIALGQQKLDDEADDQFLVWAKDRFPPALRVHLAPTNIKDVVHKRLLHKRPDAEERLRALFEAHRPDLKLYAYGCEEVTPEEFIEVYPMLPGQIDLLLQITTALRTRSARAQGDDQAIRGLLQILGELFRAQHLADEQVGRLVTLDQVYEVQHTALDADVQASMARLLSQCTADADKLLVRAAKAVALLELIQDTHPTDARLVAQCLYDQVDRGNQVAVVTEALEELRRRNLLAYSEKLGYKLQSSAGEEWERERRDIPAPREALGQIVQEGLKHLLGIPDRPQLQGRSFPWAARFSDGRHADDVHLMDSHDNAAVTIDFRYLSPEERAESTWVRRSGEAALHDRLVWVCGDIDAVAECARELHRARAMVRKYKSRRDSLNPARRMLLQQEENREEDLQRRARDTIAAAWLAGRMYFRGRGMAPADHGGTFAVAIHHAATRVLPDLFPHFIVTQVQPSELLQLIGTDLAGLSPKFLGGDLGIIELDSGRYVPTCGGVVVRRVQEHVESENGISGIALLAWFGGPPYGYTPNVVKACVAGLLRAGRVRLQPEGSEEITAVRDAGVRDLFEKDRDFKRAIIFPAGQDDIGFQSRARICRFFEDRLGVPVDREDDQIANAVVQHFPELVRRLRDVQDRLSQLPGSPEGPAALGKLSDALEKCLRNPRQTRPTVLAVKSSLDALRDGVSTLDLYGAELTPEAIRAVRNARDVLDYQAAQLAAMGITPDNVTQAVMEATRHLEGDRPWLGISTLDSAFDEIRACYQAERRHLLQWQEQQAEAARARVRARTGFSTLTADQAHQILRPFTGAVTDTTEDAVAPPLTALSDPFTLALQRAENEANERLDEILSDGDNGLVVPVDLHLRNRELETEDDVQALTDEIRERLLEHIQSGTRVRLL